MFFRQLVVVVIVVIKNTHTHVLQATRLLNACLICPKNRRGQNKWTTSNQGACFHQLVALWYDLRGCRTERSKIMIDFIRSISLTSCATFLLNTGTEIPGGRRGEGRGSWYLTRVHCHHQNDFRIKMGRYVSQFTGSLRRAKSRDSVHKNHTNHDQKGQRRGESTLGPSADQPSALTTRPSRLAGFF